MRGEYIIRVDGGNEIVIPNTITAEGGEQWLAELFQLATPAALYLGLCNQVPSHADTLSDITSEPTIGTGTYARQLVARNGTDFPSIDTANEESFITTKIFTFTATGADFDEMISRLFLCSVATGFIGTLFSYSAAMPAAITIAAGSSLDVQYRVYLS